GLRSAASHHPDAGRIDPDAFFGRGSRMEVLTSILSAMKLSGSVFLEAEFSAPWCVASQLTPEDCAAYFPEPAHLIFYHYVISGSLMCRVGNQEPVELREGQIFLIPRNERHLMGSDIALKPVNANDLVTAQAPLARIV